jgi:uncharacterized membrane protein
MKTNWKTWSPFQSPEVREICVHMTDAERAQVAERGGGYGFWVVATFALPLAFALTSRSSVAIIIAAVLVSIHIVAIPFWQRRQKQFLCSTAWAREQGYTPERLRLFGFRV